MARHQKIVGVVAVGLVAAACGSPTSPSPAYPSVSGSYSGAAEFVQGGGTTSCAASTTVTQSDRRVTIAPLTLGPPCTGVFELGTFSITTSGAIDGADNGSYADSSCGGTYAYSGSGGFSERDLTITYSYSSASSRCTLRTVRARLTRS